MPSIPFLARRRAAFAVAALGSFLSADALASLPSPTDVLTLGPRTNPASVTFGHFSRDESSPAIASDGTGSLLVWADGLATDPKAQPIVACTRYDASGVVVDSPPLALSLRGAPSVVWDGTKYLVVAGGSAQHVDAATGAVDAPFAFGGGTGFVAPPALASGGGAIASAGSTTNGAAEASIFDASGGFKGRVTLGSTSAGSPVAVAYAGGVFFAAWVDGHLLKAARVSPAGVLLDTTPITIAGAAPPADGGVAPAPSDVDVTGSSTGFLVSWTNGNVREVRVARVGADGTVADPEGLLVSSSNSHGPHAAWNGSAWWITWIEGSTALMASLDATGKLGELVAVGSQVFASHFIGATSGSRFFLAWDDESHIAGEVVSLAGATPTAGVTTLLSRFPDPQTKAKVFASTGGYLVSWQSNGHLGLRFTSAGTPIDSAPIALNGAPIGAIGDAYILVAQIDQWDQMFTASTLPAAADAGAGTTLGTFGMPNDAYDQFLLGGACAADRCAVVFLDARHEYGAEVAIVTALGVLAPDISIQIPTLDEAPVSAASDGTSFLVGLNTTLAPVGATGSIGPFQTSLGPIAGVAAGAGQFAWFMSGDGISELPYRPASATDAGSDAGDDGGTDGGADAGSDASVPNQTFLAGMSTSNVQVVWDGRAFLTAVTANHQAMGVELPSFGSTAAAPTPFAVAANGATLVAAIPSASSAVFVSTPTVGPFAIPSLEVRWVSFGPEAPDGGTDAGDDGGTDAGDDAGPADGGPTMDGGGPMDGGGHPDAGPTDAGGHPDATVPPMSQDGGPAVSPSTDTGGCGCRAAGSRSDGPWWLLSFGLLGAVARRRTRRGAL